MKRRFQFDRPLADRHLFFFCRQPVYKVHWLETAGVFFKIRHRIVAGVDDRDLELHFHEILVQDAHQVIVNQHAADLAKFEITVNTGDFVNIVKP